MAEENKVLDSETKEHLEEITKQKEDSIDVFNLGKTEKEHLDEITKQSKENHPIDVLNLGETGFEFPPEAERKVTTDYDHEGSIMDFAWSAVYGISNILLSTNAAAFSSNYYDKFGAAGNEDVSEEAYKTFKRHTEYMRAMQFDKGKSIELMQKAYKDAPSQEKPFFAISAAIADQTMTSLPQVAQEFQKDPVMDSVYNISNVGLGIVKNTGLSLMTGGGVYALGLFQTMDSGVSMYNQMTEVKSMTNNPDMDPFMYGLASGVATGLTFGLSELFGKFVINKFVQKYLSKSVIPRMTVGSLRNSGEFVSEHFIRNKALETSGQEPLEMNSLGLATSILFGGAFEVIRSKYALETVKGDPIAYNKMKNDIIERASVLETHADRAIKEVFGDTSKFKGRLRSKFKILVNNMSAEETKAMQKGVLSDLIEEVMGDGADIANLDSATFINKIASSDDMLSEVEASSKGMFAKQKVEVESAMYDIAVDNVRRKLGDNVESESAVSTALQREIRNDRNGTIRNYFDSITEGEFLDKADFQNQVLSRIDDLNVDDITKNNLKTIFDDDNLDDVRYGMIQDADKRSTMLETLTEEATDIIYKTKRYKLLSDVYQETRNIIEPFMNKMPSILEITNGKTMLDSAEYYKIVKKYGAINKQYRDKSVAAINKNVGNIAVDNLPERFSSFFFAGLKDRADNMHVFAVDPNTKYAIETLYNTIDGMIPLQGNLEMRGNSFMNGLNKYVRKNNLDLRKASRYLDILDKGKRTKSEITMNQRKLDDGMISYVADDVAKQLNMSDKEIILAHKIANFDEMLYQVHNNSRSHMPQDFASIVFDMPDFAETSGSYTGATYFPRQWSDEGKAIIKEKYGLPPDIDPTTSMYKPRSFTSAMSDVDEYRLNPLEELNIHFNKIKNSVSIGSIKRQVEKVAVKHMGERIIDKSGRIKSMKDYFAQNINNEYKNDPIAKNLLDIEKHIDDIVAPKADLTTVGNRADNTIGFLNNSLVKWYISGLNVNFTLANTAQAMHTLSPQLGFINVASKMPGAYGAAGRYVAKSAKHGFSLDKVIKDEVLTYKNTRANNIVSRYMTEGLAAGHIKNHINSVTNKNVFLDAANDSGNLKDYSLKAAEAFQDGLDKLTVTMSASDYGSRVAGLLASESFANSKIKKYSSKINKSRDLDVALKLRRELESELQINGFGSVVSQKLQKLLTEGLHSGSFDEFTYQFAKANVDVGMFQYGALNRPAFYDKLKKGGSTMATIGRFTSWPIYDRMNTRRLLTNVFNIADGKPTAANLKPLTAAMAMIASSIAIDQLILEDIDSENILKRNIRNYVVNRTVGIRTTSAILNKHSDPLGLLSTTIRLLSVPTDLTTRIIKGKKNLEPAFRPIKSLSPGKLMKIPTLSDIDEVYDAVFNIDKSAENRVDEMKNVIGNIQSFLDSLVSEELVNPETQQRIRDIRTMLEKEGVLSPENIENIRDQAREAARDALKDINTEE